MALTSHFPLQKNVSLFETGPILRKIRTLRFASVKWRDRRSKHPNKRSNFRLRRPSSHRKIELQNGSDHAVVASYYGL